MQNWNWKFTSGTICSSNGFVLVESRFQSLQQLLCENNNILDIVDIFLLNILLITIFLICYFYILHINYTKSKLFGLYFILEYLKMNSSKKSRKINFQKYYLHFFLTKKAAFLYKLKKEITPIYATNLYFITNENTVISECVFLSFWESCNPNNGIAKNTLRNFIASLI